MAVHPMHGPNKFKLGVFSMNSDGGLTLTKVPERWPALWSEIVEVAQLAPWWMLQPELQYIIRPGGGVLNPDGSFRPNAWVIAVRSSFNF